jgi:hypothetical protein
MEESLFLENFTYCVTVIGIVFLITGKSHHDYDIKNLMYSLGINLLGVALGNIIYMVFIRDLLF